MKFGIFYELQLPRPWEPGDELKLYQNALTQIELADRLGYDHAWQVEHHFLEEYSHSPAPESFLAAASQRTKQIRLGHGICQLTTNHPARVAERIATLDLLSNGRCEFGMGESASSPSWSRSASTWTTSARSSRKPCGRSSRCSRTAAASITASISTCRCATCCPSRLQKPHPAAMGRLLATRHARQMRRVGHGRARLPVRLGRCRACLGACLLQRLRQAAEEAGRLSRPIRTSRWSRSSCAPRPTRKRAHAPTATRSSSSR